MRFRHRDRETSGELADIGPGRLTDKDEAEFRELRDQLERELDELADDDEHPDVVHFREKERAASLARIRADEERLAR